MPADLRAKRAQKPWQDMEQNQRDDEGDFERRGGDQPNPCAGRRQTAQSSPRGCHKRSRMAADGKQDMARHAATGMAEVLASRINRRMAALLNWKLGNAEAW